MRDMHANLVSSGFKVQCTKQEWLYHEFVLYTLPRPMP